MRGNVLFPTSRPNDGRITPDQDGRKASPPSRDDWSKCIRAEASGMKYVVPRYRAEQSNCPGGPAAPNFNRERDEGRTGEAVFILVWSPPYFHFHFYFYY